MKKIIGLLVLLLFLAFGVMGSLIYKGIVDVPIMNETFENLDIKDTYEVEMIDVEEYYRKNSKIIEKINVKDSEHIYSEKEVFKLLTDRGFTEYEITTEYSMEGEYYDTVNISKDSKEKHPMYSVFYISDTDIFWNVTVVNGAVMAAPISYNIESESGVQVVVSESDYITGYDSETNTFYEIQPKKSFAKVIQVDVVDSRTLDKLSDFD